MRLSFEQELEKYSLALPIMEQLGRYLQVKGHVNGKTIGWHCHLTEITAAAVLPLVRAGAKLFLSECDPTTTNHEAVEHMSEAGAKVFLGTDSCQKVLDHQPIILSDTGLVLTESALASSTNIYAASEITTSGIAKIRKLDTVPIPIININSGRLKAHIENFHGVGEGVAEAIVQATGRTWSGRTAAVVGYGQVGSGVAFYLKRLGASVVVVEADPVRRLIAHYDGYAIGQLLPSLAAADLIVTATGRSGTLGANEFRNMRSGAVIMNVGHWSDEVDVSTLRAISVSRKLSSHLEEFNTNYGKRLLLVADGHPANVVMLTGSPEPTLIHLTTEILCMNYLLSCYEGGEKLAPGEQPVPPEVERQASVLALKALTIID